MTFSEKLVILRKRAEMTQAELADRLGVSKKTVLRWERGEGMPDIQKIVQLAKIFSVSTDSLLIDSVSPESDGKHEQNKQRRHVSIGEAQEYLIAKFRAAYTIAAATFIMMLSPGIMLIFMALPFRHDVLGTVLGLSSFFILAALSVSIYIYSYAKTSKYDFTTEKNRFRSFGKLSSIQSYLFTQTGNDFVSQERRRYVGKESTIP
jgi:transcriptional regulator with XRE-family HTH domain